MVTLRTIYPTFPSRGSVDGLQCYPYLGALFYEQYGLFGYVSLIRCHLRQVLSRMKLTGTGGLLATYDLVPANYWLHTSWYLLLFMYLEVWNSKFNVPESFLFQFHNGSEQRSNIERCALCHFCYCLCERRHISHTEKQLIASSQLTYNVANPCYHQFIYQLLINTFTSIATRSSYL